jgi:hypothetical protein
MTQLAGFRWLKWPKWLSAALNSLAKSRKQCQVFTCFGEKYANLLRFQHFLSTIVDTLCLFLSKTPVFILLTSTCMLSGLGRWRLWRWRRWLGQTWHWPTRYLARGALLGRAAATGERAVVEDALLFR